MKTEKLLEIRKLRQAAATVSGFWDIWRTKYAPDPHCDKKRASFVHPDDRFASFSFNLTFDAHAGYYGSSGCHTIFNLDDDLAQKYFTLAIQEMAEPLFRRASELMLRDAAKLTDEAEAEVKALQSLLEEVRSAGAGEPA